MAANSFQIPQTSIPVGSFETPARQAPVAFSELGLQVTFSAFPANATFVFSQWISRDGGATFDQFGAAGIGPGLFDKAGNPTRNWFFKASVQTGDGTPFVPQGALFKVRFDNPQPLQIASGTLTLV